MGIDIYARWSGQTVTEREAQMTGFSAVHGHVGYLREAYHGEPYATKHLVREAFESKTARANIPAAVLQERLPQTLALAAERERKVYKQSDPEAVAETLKSFSDFVALCAAKEAETGKPVEIVASY